MSHSYSISFECSTEPSDCILEYGTYLLQKMYSTNTESDIKLRFNGRDFTNEIERVSKNIGVKDNTSGLEIFLPYGESMVNFNGYKIYLIYETDRKPVGTSHSITCFKTIEVMCTTDNIQKSKQTVLSFIYEARKHCTERKSPDFVTTYMLREGGHYSFISKLPKRNIGTIYIEKDKRREIEVDIDNFFDSEERYLELGIPYKRNYLLYGPPGTGKTSLIFAIASKLDYNIALVNFTRNLDDYTFMSSISRLRDNTILVLEDIDKIFTKDDLDHSTSLTIPGLLNTLDGIARKNKLLTFMTCNNYKQINDVILRDGRVDFKLEFDFMTEKTIKEMYSKFYPESSITADTFLGKLKENEIRSITPSTLQQYFIKNLDNKDIINNISNLTKMAKSYSNEYQNLYL